MGRQKRNNNTKKKKRRAIKSQPTTTNGQVQQQGVWNFVAQAGPGCHIARHDRPDDDWILEWEQVDPKDFCDDEPDDDDDDDGDNNDGDNVPDVAIDTEERTLTVCNIRSQFVVAYISVHDVVLRDKNRQKLAQGSTTDNEGNTAAVTTLIVLCPPCTFAHLCYLDVPPIEDNAIEQISLEDFLKIESDVQVWNQHPNPTDTHTRTIGFPLGTTTTNDDATSGATTENSYYLCTQGEEGQLTHFFAGNLHAIDFRCPVGTPLLAVADGEVIQVNDKNRLTGISVNNLFQWNSILIRVDTDDDQSAAADSGASSTVTTSAFLVEYVNDSAKSGPLFVEYVHIQSSSVHVGDQVREGQIIGMSGSVGFSPEPHLHFAAYRSAEATAPTVRVYFRGNDPTNGDTTVGYYLPRAGKWYGKQGLVEKNSNAAC